MFKSKGGPLLLEVFHFITPLQFESFQSQSAIMQVLTAIDKPFKYRLIPLLNLTTLEASSVVHPNQLNSPSQLDYLVSLDFESMTSQGQKVARTFLKTLQVQLLIKQQPYTEALVADVIREIGGDLEMFYEDRHTQTPSKILVKNQQFANQFNITRNPTALVFNHDIDDYGLAIEDFTTENLEFMIQQYLEEVDHLVPPLQVLRG